MNICMQESRDAARQVRLLHATEASKMVSATKMQLPCCWDHSQGVTVEHLSTWCAVPVPLVVGDCTFSMNARSCRNNKCDL
jgi:hypothetical protein